MSNLSQIASFLAKIGLNKSAIAGVLGNLQIESGLSTSAYNKGEGAIGIAQWEGGRRTTLQQLARQMGASENSLGVQLEMLKRELVGMNLIGQLNHAGSAGAAASIFDAQFERSAGTTRSARVNFANQYYSTGHLPSGGANSPDSGSSSEFAGSALPGGLSPDDYKAALGTLSGLLDTVPELKNIFNQATSGEWSTAKFQQQIQQSHWYRSNNEATRQLLALQVADPGEYKAKLASASAHINNVAGMLGVKVSGNQLSSLALQDLMGSWDDQTLQHKLGGLYNRAAKPTGQAAQYYQQLEQLYQQYGQKSNFDQIQYRVQQLVAGGTTFDTYKQAALTSAMAMYPGLTNQLKAGLTVKDAAAPYTQTMGQLLEMDPNQINLDDPLLKRALQGTVEHLGKGGERDFSTMPMYQWEEQVRNDPRWQYTQNGKDTASSALVHIGKDFGFGGF